MANIPKFNNLTYVHPLPGSTGAEFYANNKDNPWVVKQSKKGLGGFEQVKAEAIANDIYQALGIPVPRHILDEENKALILEFIEGINLQKATVNERNKAKKELQKGFIVDALLANWDVIGLNEDNIRLPYDGSPAVRIDSGGSFDFKATGGKKAFKKVVTEIDTMRNKKISPQASVIFGDLSDTEIDTQIKTIIIPNYDKILSLTPDSLKEVMKARLDNLIERTVWMNATAFKNNVKESAEPEFIPQVHAALIKFFKDGWLKNFKNINVGPANNSDQRLLQFIDKTLKENEAVISGGFILKAIGSFVDEKSVDMDMYVPKKHAEKFREIMTKLFNSENVIKHVVSDTPGSFFKKNGILSVSKYSKSTPTYAEMDVVEVNEDRTPTDVVKNFDLTFCENWYDGENVFMAYPEHVKTKSGFLENHYLNILFTGNPVLINRMKKYIGRGFRISINNPMTKKAENITNGIVEGTLFKQQVENLSGSIPKGAKMGSYGTYKKIKKLPTTLTLPLHVFDKTKTNINYDLNKISTHIEEIPTKNIVKNKVKNTSFNNNNNFNYNNSNTLMEPFNLSILSDFEIDCIKFYTGSGASVVNGFLYLDKLPTFFAKGIIFQLFMKKFPKNSEETKDDYLKKLLYYYFVNLYNGIQKGPKVLDRPFKVYRGTKSWYLKENTDIFYYINSFTSTTVDTSVAKQFSKKRSISYIYTFIIDPLCRYMNVKDMSYHKDEDEILLTPYHRYFYISEVEDDDIVERTYVVMPTDLKIPETFETFIPWKDNIAELTSEFNKPKTSGGRVSPINSIITIKQTQPFYNMNNITTTILNRKKNTQKNLKSKNIMINNRNKKMNATRKMNNVTKVTEMSNTSTNAYEKERIQRFTEPLPSFPGKAPTPAEMDLINKMVKYFKK